MSDPAILLKIKTGLTPAVKPLIFGGADEDAADRNLLPIFFQRKGIPKKQTRIAGCKKGWPRNPLPR
jgi:hypothetical protein